MDLKVLGESISEAIALRQLIASVEQKIGETTSHIVANKKEVSRLESLISATDKLGEEKEALNKELSGHENELAKRMEKLNKAGVELPIKSGGSVSL